MSEKNEHMDDGRAPIRAYTTQELADLYGVPRRSFTNWLKDHKVNVGRRSGHFYTIKQVKIIFDSLERPYLD